MSTTFKFKNILGEELTQQQTQNLNTGFEKEYYIDGALKRIDSYRRNGLSFGTYYMAPEENLQDILKQMEGVWKSGVFYTSEQLVGNFTLRNYERYEGTTLLYKGIEIYDSFNRKIAIQELDINTSQVIKTTKTIYLQNLGEFTNDEGLFNFGTLVFDYNYPDLNPGEIDVLVNLPGFEHQDYYITQDDNILLHPMIAEIFSWDEETYYHASTPLIPNT